MGLGMFLKLNGIPGGSQDSDNKGEIELTSWGWGVTGHAVGQVKTGKPTVSEMTCMKNEDVASTALYRVAADGRPISDGTLTVRRKDKIQDDDGNTQDATDELIMWMEEIYITNLDFVFSKGAVSGEQFTIRFGKFKSKYSHLDVGPKNLRMESYKSP